MGRTSRGDNKSKQQRQQAILRLIQENPISRQETLLEYLSKEGFDATQATISRDIREMNLVKAATTTGYRYVSSHSEVLNPKMQARFETIFHESVLGVDFAGHVVLVKCYSGMANAACEVFDALKWKNVVGTLSDRGPLRAGRKDHLHRAWALHRAEIKAGENEHVEQSAN